MAKFTSLGKKALFTISLSVTGLVLLYNWISRPGRKGTSRPRAINIDSFDDPRFVWHNGAPGSGRGGSWQVEEGRLTVVPAPGLDYWSRTFYKPLLIKSDAQVLAD